MCARANVARACVYAHTHTSHTHHTHITHTSHAHHTHITRTSHAHHTHISHTSRTHRTFSFKAALTRHCFKPFTPPPVCLTVKKPRAYTSFKRLAKAMANETNESDDCMRVVLIHRPPPLASRARAISRQLSTAVHRRDPSRSHSTASTTNPRGNASAWRRPRYEPRRGCRCREGRDRV